MQDYHENQRSILYGWISYSILSALFLQHLRCLYSTSIDKDSKANNLGYHCMMWNDQPTAV